MNLELLTKQVSNISRATGSYIKNEMKRFSQEEIEKKGVNNFVTYVDHAAEKRLVTELGKILPEAGFIAEEDSMLERKEHFNWIIDPLDGTTNFIHGVPLYAISIALMQEKEIVSGVIFEINLQECFYAWQKGGAFLNGHPIEPSETKTVEESLVATGFPYTDFSRLDGYLKLFEHLMKNSHGLRRLGSAAVDLAYVACGRYDAFFEYGLNSWDVAAGAILIDEAGGRVSDFSANKNHIFGEEIIGCNPMVYEEFQKLVESKFEN